MHIFKKIPVMLALLFLALLVPATTGGYLAATVNNLTETTLFFYEEPMTEPNPLHELERTLNSKIGESGFSVSLSFYDFKTGQWLNIDSDKALYPASMIKTLLMLTAINQVEKGQLDLQTPYVLTNADKFAGHTFVSGTGILQFEEEGTVVTVEELIRLTVSHSDNIASNILMDLVGVDPLATMAEKLHLHDTRFIKKMFDLESPLPSNSSTARDLTAMLIALEKRAVVGEELSSKGIVMMKETVDKSRIGRYLPEQIEAANKIGTVSRMVGDMALIYFPDRPPVALTVMVEAPPDWESASEFIGQLALQIITHLVPGTFS